MRLYLVVLTGLRLEDSVFRQKCQVGIQQGECVDVRSWGSTFFVSICFPLQLFETKLASLHLKIDGFEYYFLFCGFGLFSGANC